MLHPAVTEKLLSRLQFETGKTAKPEKVEVLSQRELEVLNLGMEGLSNKEVAIELSLGIRTVQTHWRNIFNKLGVSSRTEAVIYGLNKGWITLKQSRSQQENTEP